MKRRSKKIGKAEDADLGFFLEVLKTPAETFSRIKAGAHLGDAVKFFAFSFALAGLLKAAVEFLYVNPSPNLVILTILKYVVGGLLASLIIVGMPFLFAVLVGGKGSFNQQYYLTSVFLAPLIVLNGIFRLVPPLTQPLLALSGLYALYLFTLVLKEVHKFSFLRSLLIWLIPLVVVFAFYITFITALLGLIFAEFALVS